jgi:amino acid permease
VPRGLPRVRARVVGLVFFINFVLRCIVFRVGSQMSFSSNDSRYSRASSVAERVATSIRASAASVVSAVEEQIEVGTIGGTVLNTTCNVVGAGVLFLPLAAARAGMVWIFVLIVFVGCIGAFSAYILFIGCDRTGAYFMSEVLAIAVVGKPKRKRKSPSAITHLDPETPLIVGAAPATAGGATDSLTTGAPPKQLVPVPRHPSNNDDYDDLRRASDDDDTDEDESLLDPDEKHRNFMRMVVSLMVDFIVFVNNYLVLAIYTRIIIDSIPPVVQDFLHAPESTIWAKQLTWLIIAAVIFFGLTSVRNFAELKWSSILGVGTIMWAAVAIFVRYLTDGYQGGGERQITYVDAGSQFFAALSTLSVAFGYHFNAPSFYRELRDRSPPRMMKTVAIAFPIIGITYAFVVIFGYLSFGAHVNDKKAGGNIVNNYGKEDALINTVRLGLFFHFACVYPVMSVCVRHSFHRFVLTFTGRRKEAIHPDMPARVPRPYIIAEAFLLVSTSSIIAYEVPDTGMLVNYVGAFAGATMLFTIPGITGLCIWAEVPELDDDSEAARMLKARRLDPPPHAHKRKLMRGLCYFLIVFGVFSTFSSLATG